MEQHGHRKELRFSGSLDCQLHSYLPDPFTAMKQNGQPVAFVAWETDFREGRAQ